MSPAITSFRLIIVNDSAQEAQRLSSMFQNAGKPCRAQFVDSEEAFNKTQEEQSWDLVIAYASCEALTPLQVIRNIRKFEHDLPVILICENDDTKSIIDGMKMGACDVVRLDDDQHLLMVVDRELQNRQQRKLTRITQRRLKEVERRNQQLLDSSRDGIAYVQDGMYLYANDSFAEILGYNDKSDIEFMPLMDGIDEEDHQNIKETLKNFSLQNKSKENKNLEFQAILSDGSKKKIAVELFLGEYDDEQCIQFIIHAKLGNQDLLDAEIESVKHTDMSTGLYTRRYLIDNIEAAVDDATTNETASAFIYIDIDNFANTIEKSLNINGIDELLKSIASIMKQYNEKDAVTGRISDHSLGIITKQHDIEKLVDSANQLCSAINEEFFEINQKTLQITISVGICLINETSTDAKTVLNHSLEAIETLRKSSDGNGANIYQKETNENEVLAGSLKKAIENNNFTLLFQPIISLRGEETERYEVLLRMIDENNTHISPTHFLDTAKNLKLSTKIDRWVILESIKYLREHLKKAKDTQQFINLSNDSLCDETLLPWLKVAFEASSLDPKCIIFQAKEMDIVQHLTAVKKLVAQANSMGVEFCITSFGCSLEPMSTLEHIDARYIKIDGSFSQDLQDNPKNSEGLEKLVQELHEKEKVTTIPLVENASILSKLWQLGVHCIQGHYLQAPSSAMDYEFSSEDE